MSLAQTVINGVKTAIQVAGDLLQEFTVQTYTRKLNTATNVVDVTSSTTVYIGVYDDTETSTDGKSVSKDETKVFLFKRDSDDLSLVETNSEIYDASGTKMNIVSKKPIFAGTTIVVQELMVSE